MIEIFNNNRTKSLGRFKSFKAAKGTLNGFIISGELGENPSVFVCSYNGDEPQREYTATYYGGKWHMPKLSKVSQFIPEGRIKRRHKKSLCKEYTSPEAMFNEGFPDWLNRSYPVPAPKQQGMNVRKRMHARCC